MNYLFGDYKKEEGLSEHCKKVEEYTRTLTNLKLNKTAAVLELASTENKEERKALGDQIELMEQEIKDYQKQQQ